jgi:osmotically-inducible protein OsmY
VAIPHILPAHPPGYDERREDAMADTRGPDPEVMSPEDRRLAVAIDRLLQEEAGIYAAVRVGGGVAYLDGMVDSAAQRDAASDLAGAVEGITRVQNDLEVEEFGAPGEAAGADGSVYADTTYQMLDRERVTNPQPLMELNEPDFNEPIPEVGGDMTTNSMIAAEEGIPYMPPTDPVVRPSNYVQELEIVTGFGATSAEEFPDTLATSALGDAPPGDEDIRQQVVEALRSDAATTDLLIDVVVRNGVVRLRGRVPTLDDAESAEEVAGRVPTVVEVIEELEVAALE